MLSSSHRKIHEPLVTGVSPRPTDQRQRQKTAKHEGVGAENRVTSCDLRVLVHEAAESILSKHAGGRAGTWRVAGCGRALIQ
jgi:hypothetical protein